MLNHAAVLMKIDRKTANAYNSNINRGYILLDRRIEMIELQCFHGTTMRAADSILKKGFLPSFDSEKLRLGNGIYFFGQGGSSDYAIDCAREIERYHHQRGKHTGEYAILSCSVKCEEDQFFDMYNPEYMEYFHRIRYALYKRKVQDDKDFAYKCAEVADTETMNFIRECGNVAVIRCPQFFGMFPREASFKTPNEKRYPKTMVPNILLVCADSEKCRIEKIVLIEKGRFDDGFTESV